MKKRFTKEQIIGFLREAETDLQIKDTCRKHGFSEASHHLWRGKFGSMSVSDAKRLKGLEAEYARLNKPLAEQVFENDVIKAPCEGNGGRTGPLDVGAEDGREGIERAACACRGAHARQCTALRAQVRPQRGTARAYGCAGAPTPTLWHGHDLSEAATERFCCELQACRAPVPGSGTTGAMQEAQDGAGRRAPPVAAAIICQRSVVDGFRI